MSNLIPSIEIIVAIAEDGAIGLNGDMPWGRHLPIDLRHFKETTMGYPILMGRKTFEGLPNGALPGRQNLVMTHNTTYYADGGVVVHSLDEALSAIGEASRLFVIGGGELYRTLLPYARVLHLTQVHHSWPNADTYFPSIDLDEWQCEEQEYHSADERNLYGVTFTRWTRKE